MKTSFKTVDEYIAHQPLEYQSVLQEIRLAIIEAAPEAREVISYQMPAFKQNGMLVYFALFKKHISFFPMSSGVQAFLTRLKNYKTSKGTIQFPLDQAIPLDLIREITMFRVQENLSKKIK